MANMRKEAKAERSVEVLPGQFFRRGEVGVVEDDKPTS
jgi:hypothetical protein